ncbi:MAG TPA: hypothetical protein VJ732_07955 [Bryobacteraceae bacterium]|nr:hypothetical protein [Bryobacteraceae bacterium]
MNMKKWLITGGLAGVLAAAPGASMAIEANRCVTGTPTAASYTWNFPKEATRLLNGMRQDANGVADHAAKLEMFATEPNLSWQAHADQLTRIKAEVNDMGMRLCRLQVIQRVSEPWQRQITRRAAPLVQYMADNTEDAINYLNAHQGDFWVPAYRMYTRNLYTEATTLARRIHAGQELAKVQNAHPSGVVG